MDDDDIEILPLDMSRFVDADGEYEYIDDQWRVLIPTKYTVETVVIH